ncbi:MAG: asparagine synthase (glutamine-hydrolyzing) [Woeseiaceae bacterium]|nr:asparagine synthase (glutamine-hydrolyzing) [Woeseiaceae bacterium]NIP21175.1 asparagine synthase (glutamine-hydrolyzing) [Woeseiaceae bacterium]NIS90147.1 asparagine synthase (glutamine-hydrolyzing) [Woeseiaceae bacterium]
MCGIAGFSTSATASRDAGHVIADMLRHIEHRGPDESGVALGDKFALGQNRLTIIEPDGGQQPRCNEASGNTLIYNGEIYNHHAFDGHIQRGGGRLRDRCDTETLFWLLELEGIEKTLAMIDGMFAFAWYEAGSDTLYLARDRFGQKPLFYAQRGEEFIFASEIRALRRHPALRDVEPDLDALRLYLMLEYVPAPATGIDGVSELPAGHVLTYHNGQVDVRRYFDARGIERRKSVDQAAAASELDGLLQENVAHQLVADVPVGVFLSGGLDSSLVAAVARRQTDDVASFTVKFGFSSFDESPHAEQVAATIGTRHTTIELGRQNCVDAMADLLARVDQPFSDSSMLPSYLLCQATKQYVTVALGGDGADELFLGYPNFRLARATRLMAMLPQSSGALLRGVAGLMPVSSEYMNRAFLLRQLSYGVGRPARLQSMYWMAAIPPTRQQELWIGGGQIDSAVAAMLDRLVPATAGLPVIEEFQQHFIDRYLAGDILQKMDRASMAVSLEVRSPYLANAVSDFALSLPVDALLRGATGKRILRDVARSYLPDEIIDRRKHGFALPVSALLRSDLRDVAEATLLDSSNRMYELVSHGVVQNWWSEHLSGDRDNGKALLALLMMAAFFRNHFQA